MPLPFDSPIFPDRAVSGTGLSVRTSEPLYGEIWEFLYREAALLDEDRHWEWIDIRTEDSDGLTFEGDFLELSFRSWEQWPNRTPKGSLRSYHLDLGDPTRGPSLVLGLFTNVKGEQVDWRNDVDPAHHHGTDQFRAVAGHP